MNYLGITLVGLLASGCYWSKDPGQGGGSTLQVPSQTAPETQPPVASGQTSQVALSAKARVFITRATYTGNLGGVLGADAKCRQAAQNAGLKGLFVAFLSDSTHSAASRIAGNGPWVNMKGEELFGAAASSWTGFPKTAIRYDESGNWQMTDYWTGSKQGSIPASNTCENWFSEEPEGQVGTGSWADKLWVTSALGIPCDFERALLCAEIR